MCKPCVNQILPCANQNQPCVNYFAPYANPQFSAIPTCFAKPSGHTSYFHVLITCRTFPVQPGEVTFWDQKKFTHFITVSPGLPPDVVHFRSRQSNLINQSTEHNVMSSCGKSLTSTSSMRILDQGSTIPAPVDYDGILKPEMEGASGLQSTDSTQASTFKF